MSLNLHLLRLFVTVARLGSFSRAAEALHISQPAVSRGVREFEDQVGSRLLERGPDGAVPTEAGKILLSHAAILFAAERAAEEDLSALRGMARGTLSIGASTTISTWFLPALLAEYHHSYPAIKLNMQTANTAQVVERLLLRELDIALVEGPVDHPGILVQPWRQDRLVWIAASTHPLATIPVPLTVASLADELMIVREQGSGTRDVGWTALAEHGVFPCNVLEIGGTEAIKQAVAAGMGIALVSESAVRAQLPQGDLVILDIQDFSVSRTLTRLSLLGRQPSAAAAKFEKLLERVD